MSRSAKTPLSEILRAWREQSGVSLDTLTLHVNSLLPASEQMSRQSLWRYENGQLPKNGLCILVVMALTAALQHETKDLPPEIQVDIAKYAHLNKVLRMS